jgi:integration host factor subunit beta
MVKSELIKKLCDLNPNVLKKDIIKTIDIIFNEISKALKNNMKFEIRGYGTFKVKNRKARIAKNPKTGEKISIPERKNPFFKMSKIMKIRLNKNFDKKEINNI